MSHSETYIDGVYYPSVTTILASKSAPYLEKWRERWGILAIRKMKIASAIGTEFHRCVEEWLNTGDCHVRVPTTDEGVQLPSTAIRVISMMDSWVQWARTIEGTIRHTEMKVVSKKYVYSGTLDAVGTLDGKPVIFDWKTSARIYADMQLQLAAYAQAYKEETNIDVKWGLIVCTSKDKPYFKTTSRIFSLGKGPLKKFLKLRKAFQGDL